MYTELESLRTQIYRHELAYVHREISENAQPVLSSWRSPRRDSVRREERRPTDKPQRGANPRFQVLHLLIVGIPDSVRFQSQIPLLLSSTFPRDLA